MLAAVATSPMRATVRRKRLKAARAAAEQQATADVAALLDSRYKTLCRELRRGNMRKRLSKSDSLEKAVNIDWPAWIKNLSASIRAALLPIILAVQGVESDYWDSRGGEYDEGDPDDVIDGYEGRTGRSLDDIGTTTQTGILAAIQKWYSDPGQTFPALLAAVGVYFSADRADEIVGTEGTNITSEVAQDAMGQFGITQWLWDLAPDEGPWPCQACIDMSEGGPYGVDDQMPPIHPNDRCGVIYVEGDNA